MIRAYSFNLQNAHLKSSHTKCEENMKMGNLLGSAVVGCVVDPKSSRSPQLSTLGLLSASSARAATDIYTSNHPPPPASQISV